MMSTLDGAGGPPYDQDAMGKVRELQQLGVVKVGYDRPSSTTARAEDVELFASGDPEKIKLTMWFYGYATAMKRCIAIESQNFDGLLELICIHGGPITTVEAQEMPRILADAAHDASMAQPITNDKERERSIFVFPECRPVPLTGHRILIRSKASGKEIHQRPKGLTPILKWLMSSGRFPCSAIFPSPATS